MNRQVNAIAGRLSLRPPQRHSLEILDRVTEIVPPHKAAQVQEAVEQAQAKLIFLPPYSPDLNPIEPCWSKVKQHVRSAEPRTGAALGLAAAHGFASVTGADAKGWFEKCGYCVH